MAGSPVDPDIRWTNRSVPALATELQDQGFEIGPDAMRKILFEQLDLSRRQAFKEETACRFPQRDEQFQYLGELRAHYERQGWPILSIDTKKKEILGNFFAPGQAWTDGRVIVRDHDFVTAEQRLVPYGVYDVQRNEGLMLLSRGADTCELACDALWRWWLRMGQRHYAYAPRLLVLCDCGAATGLGSIGSRKSCVGWRSICVRICRSRTTRPAARSTTRSSIGCSATSRGPGKPWCSRACRWPASSSPARLRPRGCG